MFDSNTQSCAYSRKSGVVAVIFVIGVVVVVDLWSEFQLDGAGGVAPAPVVSSELIPVGVGK